MGASLFRNTFMNKLFLSLILFCSSHIFSQLCDIKGLNKREVLRALFAHATAKPGFEALHKDRTKLHKKIVNKIVHDKVNPCSVDYVYGRAMHIMFAGDVMDTQFYNRANGAGVAEEAIKKLRK